MTRWIIWKRNSTLRVAAGFAGLEKLLPVWRDSYDRFCRSRRGCCAPRLREVWHLCDWDSCDGFHSSLGLICYQVSLLRAVESRSMLRSSALRRFSTITSCISSGMAVKRDNLIPESTELLLLLLDNTASAVSDSVRILFASGLPSAFSNIEQCSREMARIRNSVPLGLRTNV